MEINKGTIVDIIVTNRQDNVICRALELRSSELAKYICGLANKLGGYILLGVEKKNGSMLTVGCLTSFDVFGVIEAAKEKVTGEVESAYGFMDVMGVKVFVVEVKQSEQKLLLEGKYYEYTNNGICEKVINEKDGPFTLFISYTECDAPIVEIIENKIKVKLKDKIIISKYTDLQYKESFKAFMDTIQEHDFVLTVVSDTYLKRQACMYEVGEIIKDNHYKDKLLFVVISENERKYFGESAPVKIEPDIYSGAVEKLSYTGFWKDKYEALKDTMRSIGDYEALAEVTKDLQAIGQIYRKDMGEFLKFLSDENGLSFQRLCENEFEEIVRWIMD
jgi:hypothetical protein